MDELNNDSAAIWPRVILGIITFVIFFGLIFLSLPGFYAVDSYLVAAAVKHCPAATFFSGRVYSHWSPWAYAAVFLATFLLILNSLSYLKAVPKNNRLGMPWRSRGVYGLCACIALAGAATWFSDVTSFCAATSGIYFQRFPTDAFQRHPWKNVDQISVDCGYGRHGTETSYILKLKDGGSVDIADAWPMPGPVWPPSSSFDQFANVLSSVPFKFSAKIRPDCSKNLVSWVSQRP